MHWSYRALYAQLRNSVKISTSYPQVNKYATRRSFAIAQLSHEGYLSHMPQTPPLSATDASLQTGIPKRTILWAINTGKLKAHKFGGSTGAYVIQQRDLDRFVAKREQQAS
jgi:hypothetical protein